MPNRLIISGIYLIFNKVNKKKYVGSSNNIYHRFDQHREVFRGRRHWNPHFQHAWDMYGEDNFKFSILERVPEEKDLTDREQYWMDKLEVCNPEKGYNIQPRADRSIVSEETKKKIGNKNRGKKHSEESIQKMREIKLGKFVSDETRQKISESNKGRKNSPESIEQGRLKRIGFKHSEESKQKMSEAQLNQSDETRLVRSEAAKKREIHGHSGCTHSEESRQKISEGCKAAMTEERRQQISEMKTGTKHTPETLAKMSESHKDYICSEETKEKIRQSKLGKKRSPETIAKIKESRKGFQHTEETKKKISEAGKGRKMSEEHKTRLSEIHSGKTISEEHKQKLRDANTGKKMPEEQRQKMLGRKLSPESIAKREATRKRNKELKLAAQQAQP